MIRVVLTPRMLRVKVMTYDADGYSVDDDGSLDLYRGSRLVGSIKETAWVAVIIETDD